MTNNEKLSFDFNWKISLSVVFLFPLFVMLSIWQMDRAEQKKDIASAWAAQQGADPIAMSNYQDSAQFQRVFLQGKFLEEKYWLKENQFYNGQLGYNVIMPFALESGETVAIDRGWVLGSPMRDFVPEVLTPSDSIRITGTLVTPTDSKLIREAETRAKSWPHKILEVDIPVLSKQSGLSLHRKLLRIDPDSPGALEVYWKPTNMSPAKHYGYATQWGLMALALVIMFIYSSSNFFAWIKNKI